MKTATYHGNINDFQLPELVKKTNKTSIAISIVLIIFALAMFHLVYFTDNDWGEGSEVFAGVIALGMALFMLIWQRTKYIDKETDSVVSKDRFAENHRYIAVQVLKYEPFDFKQQTDILVYRDANAMKLVEYLK